MKAIDFCYWLQGAFELNETAEFNAHETKTIKDHLDLVFIEQSQPNSFCYFLRGYFTLSSPQSLNKDVTATIKKQLSNTFLNEIDPSYPADEQQQLSDIHNGSKYPQIVERC